MINAYDLYTDLFNNALSEYTANYAEGTEYLQGIIDALPLNLTEVEQLEVARNYVLLFATAVWLDVRDDDFISALQSELIVAQEALAPLESEIARLTLELDECKESCKGKRKPRTKPCKKGK